MTFGILLLIASVALIVAVVLDIANERRRERERLHEALWRTTEAAVDYSGWERVPDTRDVRPERWS